MYPYKAQNHKQKSVKGNGNKNRSRSIITNNKSIKNPNLNNNYINRMKKELLGRPREDQALYTKKASRNAKLKSIDSSIYNQKMNQNSLSFYNNSNQPFIQKFSKPFNNNNINYNNINCNNINIVKEIKNNLKKKNLYNIKNVSPFLKSQNLTSNSNYSIISNVVNEPSSSNEILEESKNNLYECDNYKVINPKHLTTYLQIDDLTPIPDRIGCKQHYLAEYDYDEAKRAAVTCRRIEYSYNLRNIIKSEISLDEIITIQRWWRGIIRKRNKELYDKIKMQEEIRLKYLQKYILFINKLHHVYTMHLVLQFINRLKMKNIFNKKAVKIQNAYRAFIRKRELKRQLKLRAFIRKLSFRINKRNLFYILKSFIDKMKKFLRLQNFIKFYLLKRKESYYLKMAHNIHPLIYYYLKYGIMINDKNVNLIKKKKEGFMNMVQKWKKITKSKKLLRSWIFMEKIKFILKKKYFIYFILRIVERINSMITYFLLKPLMKDILYIYYRKKLKKKIIIWKTQVKKMGRKDSLALNLIFKIIKIFAFKPFIKRIKKQKVIKNNNGNE